MAADASIYSLIQQQRPPPDPMQQYGQMLQVGHLMDSGALSQLQRKQLEGSIADDEATAQAYREANGDPQKVRDLLYGRGLYKPALAAEKAALEKKKTQGEIDFKSIETTAKAVSIYRDQLAAVNTPQEAQQWVLAGYQDPNLSPILQRGGSPQERIARIPQDPQGFADWKMRNGAGIEKFLEMTAPKVAMTDVGSTIQPMQTNPLAAGGVAPVAGAAPLQKTQTPESVASNAVTREGQKLVDARERDVPLAASIAGAREVGKETAVAQMALPAVVSQAERGVRLIDEMLGTKGKTLAPGEKEIPPHEGFQGAVGVSMSKALSPFWSPPGFPRRDFEARLDEIKGGAFMQAFNSLKGGGQITEAEGRKATQAITRMETSQSEKEFVKAAREFQGVVQTGLENAKKRASTNLGGVLTRQPDGSFTYGFGNR